MAQLKDLLVNGSARVIGSLFANLSGNVLNFGVCSTAAATAAKTVTTNGTFELITGSKILVLFSETDSSNAPTLNVNGTGAKSIKINASDGIPKGFLVAQQYYWFVYDGSAWRTAGGNGNININAGTANRMAYYSEANIISAAARINYLNNIEKTYNSQKVYQSGLRIWGNTYGNTANQLISNTDGVFRYGDGGPQIQFSTRETESQDGALIFTDHDAAGTGASFHFVSNQGNDNNGGNLTVTAPRFRARKGLTIGQNSDNTSYKLYVNGTSYFNGNTTYNGTLYFANGTTYYVNNSALGYLADLRVDKMRLEDNRVGFYQNANASGNRYGFIQTDSSYMYFRKENGNSGFSFNGHLIPSATDTYDLGSSSLRWRKLYVGSADSYGSSTLPVYWNNGVPTAVSELKEDYITWNGKNGQNTWGPIDTILNDWTRGNGFAGLPADYITIYHSTDSGATWTATTSISNNIKRSLVTNCGANIRLVTSGNLTNDATKQVKIVIKCSGKTYFQLKKIHIFINTSGSSGTKVTIKGSLNSNATTFNQIVCENTDISGWPDWNSISCDCTVGSNSNQIHSLEFVFKQSGVSSSYVSSGLMIYGILGFGLMKWTAPSSLANWNHNYTIDSDLNTTFPSQIYATTLNGNLAKKLIIQANGVQKGQFNNSADITVNLGNVAQDFTGANSGNAANINADTFAGMTRQQWLNTVYPIGSIYMSVNATSPASLFGGTWESLGGRFLIGQDETYTAGSTGGEASHTLTLAEAPAHTHGRGTMNITGGYKTGWNDASGGGIISSTWSGAMYGSRNGTAFYYYNPMSSTSDNHKNYINFDASRSWTGETDSKGGGVAHNNMPPYLVVYMWKRTA